MENVERITLFHGVDGFMLGPVIAEDALDIGYAANQVEISDQQGQANDTLEREAEPALTNLVAQQASNEKRPQEEDGDGKAQRDNQCQCQRQSTDLRRPLRLFRQAVAGTAPCARAIFCLERPEMARVACTACAPTPIAIQTRDSVV